jgi:hypothetical protein
MEKAPAVTGEAAEPGDVTTGQKYWGLSGGKWGIETGTSTAVDTSSGNATANEIRKGKIAWADGKEVVGTSTAVDTRSGNATANDIKEGKIAWVDGEKVVGTLKLFICNGTMHGERWCDNENGTVLDMTTGLVWLQKADWGGRYAFACRDGSTCKTIFDRVLPLKSGDSGTNLTDGSVGGDWRIPTKTELTKLTLDPEKVLSSEMGLFSGVQSSYDWSATTRADGTSGAWAVYLTGGAVYTTGKAYTDDVWPVRSRH